MGHTHLIERGKWNWGGAWCRDGQSFPVSVFLSNTRLLEFAANHRGSPSLANEIRKKQYNICKAT